MNKITIYVLLACLWTVSAVQAQSFGSPAMRKLQMAESVSYTHLTLPTILLV